MDNDHRKSLPCNKGFKLTITDEDTGNWYTVCIGQELGRGGSCIVYRGWIQNKAVNDKAIIIKEFYPKKLENSIDREDDYKFKIEDRKDQVTFDMMLTNFREGQNQHIIFANDNPNYALPSVFHIGKALGTFYALSDLADGETLSAVKKDKYTIADALKLTASICSAVEKVHQQYKVYLDLKPSNVFVNQLRDGDQLYLHADLFDFNTVYPIDKISYCSYSEGWSAPEQMPDNNGRIIRRNIGVHSDVYAVGVILFWLLTCKDSSEPPKKENIEGISKGIDWKEHIILTDSNDALSSKSFTDKLNRLLKRMLNPKLEERKKHYNGLTALESVIDSLNILIDYAETASVRKEIDNTRHTIADSTASIEETVNRNSVKHILFGSKKRIILTISFILIITATIGIVSALIGTFANGIISSTDVNIIEQEMDSHILLKLSNANHQYEVGLENWRRLDYNRAERDILAARNELSEEISQGEMDVAKVNNSMGCLYLDMGRYEDAYDYLNSSLTTFRNVYGEDENETLAVMYSMAQYDYYTGDVDTALKTIQRIIDKTNLEENKTVAISVRLFQGMIYDELGDYKSAVDSYKETLALFDEISDDGTLVSDFADYVNDPELSEDEKDRFTTTLQWIILTYNLLGEAYIHSEDYEQAQKVLDLALDMSLDNIYIGKKNLTTSKIYMNLAKLYREKNDIKTALDNIDLAMRIQKNLFDYEGVYPGLVEVYDIYGDLLLQKSENEKAKEYFDDSYTLAVDSYGENHPMTADARFYQGMYWLYQKNYQQADKAFEDAIEIRKNILGYKNVKTVEYLYYASCMKKALNDTKAAVTSAEEALNLASDLGISGSLLDKVNDLVRQIKNPSDLAA